MSRARAAEVSTAEIASDVSFGCPERGADAPAIKAGAGRLTIRGAPLGPDALTALFPEFTTGESLAGLATWRPPHGRHRMRARAAALGVPFLTFDRGLLRAPPRYGAASAVLSVTAVAMEGPLSSADILSPDRLLASRGWESPALLERATLARRELIAARIGGSWWGRSILSGGEGIALVDGEAMGSSRPEAALRAMLAAALAENPADKVVVVSPSARDLSLTARRYARLRCGEGASRCVGGGRACRPRLYDRWRDSAFSLCSPAATSVVLATRFIPDGA